MGKAIGLALLIIIVLSILGYVFSKAPHTALNPKTIPVLTWLIQESDSLNLDGLPKTNVFVVASYPDGDEEQRLVDTVEGGCAPLPAPEKDGATFQCYAGGAGSKYKITKKKSSFVVERKLFGEVLPDQNPINSKYEVVSEFSFTK